MKYIFTVIVTFLFWQVSIAQNTCVTATNLGIPSSTSSCTSGISTTGSGNTAGCSGSGFGGSGSVYYVAFCTNAANDCVVLDITTSTTSNVELALYTGCSLGGCCGSGYVSGSIECSTLGTGMPWSSTDNDFDMVTTANTCYVARIWVKNGGTIDVCAYTQTPSNDECVGATPIDGTPTIDDNFCATEGATDPSPAQICAGSIENTTWYTFTVLADGDVVITIDNIICSGGGAGFQIGFFSGSCGSLTNDGCSSGSGGTVTATYTGLTAGDVLYIVLDGNAGANCTYDISATNTVALPIELVNFGAKYIKEYGIVELNWVTETEINNAFYTIEKSKDGEIFEVVGIVDGAGNSTTVNSYSLADQKPYKGTSYYRLAQTDYDGTTTYSALAAVTVESSFGDLTVFPNPIKGIGYLVFDSDVDGVAEIVIYNIAGKRIFTQQYYATKGNNEFELTTVNLPQGMYFLTVSNDKETSNIKFVKN
ncbi:MAG: hypothetical protein COA97_06510 [Flavobacteriales bacterium]|nr:MAG: hypothetical protein COA97_06510 [Flavobacteriales bacterium]